MNRTKGQAQGFALIELLLTLVLLGAGIVGLVQLATLSVAIAQNGRERETAMLLAESKIAEYRLLMGTMAAPNTMVNLQSGEDEQTLASRQYTLSWTIHDEYFSQGLWQSVPPAQALPWAGRKAMVVTVIWQDSQGVLQNLSLASHISPLLRFSALTPISAVL